MINESELHTGPDGLQAASAHLSLDSGENSGLTGRLIAMLELSQGLCEVSRPDMQPSQWAKCGLGSSQEYSSEPVATEWKRGWELGTDLPAGDSAEPSSQSAEFGRLSPLITPSIRMPISHPSLILENL